MADPRSNVYREVVEAPVKAPVKRPKHLVVLSETKAYNRAYSLGWRAGISRAIQASGVPMKHRDIQRLWNEAEAKAL